jgi:hypothetical protein
MVSLINVVQLCAQLLRHETLEGAQEEEQAVEQLHESVQVESVLHPGLSFTLVFLLHMRVNVENDRDHQVLKDEPLHQDEREEEEHGSP